MTLYGFTSGDLEAARQAGLPTTGGQVRFPASEVQDPCTLPRSLRVGPHSLTIVHMTPSQVMSCGAIGEFSSAEQTIRLQADAPSPSVAVDTLLHELGHAICWAYGILPTDDEERTVTVTATAWTQIFKDNPRLLAWISAQLA